MGSVLGNVFLVGPCEPNFHTKRLEFEFLISHMFPKKNTRVARKQMIFHGGFSIIMLCEQY